VTSTIGKVEYVCPEVWGIISVFWNGQDRRLQPKRIIVRVLDPNSIWCRSPVDPADCKAAGVHLRSVPKIVADMTFPSAGADTVARPRGIGAVEGVESVVSGLSSRGERACSSRGVEPEYPLLRPDPRFVTGMQNHAGLAEDRQNRIEDRRRDVQLALQDNFDFARPSGVSRAHVRGRSDYLDKINAWHDLTRIVPDQKILIKTHRKRIRIMAFQLLRRAKLNIR